MLRSYATKHLGVVAPLQMLRLHCVLAQHDMVVCLDALNLPLPFTINFTTLW
jgi:hypothetical protein